MSDRRSFLDRLADFQHRRAGLVFVVAVALTAASLPLVFDLGLDSSFTALLPDDKPSVHDLRELEDRVGGLETLTVALRSPSKDREALMHLARDLVPRLEHLDPAVVRSVDWNVAAFEDFVTEHKGLYASLSDLREIRDALDERLQFEKARANPFYVQLDDEEPPDPEEIIERMRRRAEEGRRKMERFPGGFYLHPDGDLLAIFVRCNLKGGDAKGTERLIKAIDAQVADLGLSNYGHDLRVEYGGSLVIGLEEHDALAKEMVVAVLLTVAGVLIAIFVFFRKLRALFLLGAALITPVMVTFGLAEVIVDYLNTSTIFLGSIVIGNGINPNIVWLARYFEERRRGADVLSAIKHTHRSTWLATLTASLAAGTAYGSLVITDFRGFRDFGIIGGTGMVLCWVGALVILPALAALTERIRSLSFRPGETERGNLYGRLFARMVYGWPRAIVVVSSLLGLAVVGLGAYAIAVRWDPLEYDFRNLRSVREGSGPAREINRRVGEMVSTSEQGNGILVVAPTRDTARELEADLESKIGHGAPWKAIHSIDDLLPKQQEEKIPVLRQIRDLLLEVRPYANDEQQHQIDENIPPENITPLGVGDLPESVARTFTERDGTRGRILVVEKVDGKSSWDGRYLVAWSNALRQERLPDGSRPPLAGRAPVFADIIEVVWTDGPKAVAASFLATLLLVLIGFRRARERLLTMLSLVLGIIWMAGAMALAGMKLNFLNFVAFPITFGNGVDYGVNVMRRYALETAAKAKDPVRRAIEESGGAVILCSLTTIIGYSTLYTSANLALNSFGAAMAISETTCLAAAVLTAPAILLILERRARNVQ